MKLIGYQTSHKEIRDLYHIIYLLRRSPGLLPCGPQQRREAIWDILSSLRNCLYRQVYPTTSEEDAQGSATESWSRSWRKKDTRVKALQEGRVAHQRALEAARVLESDIKRLSWRLKDAQCPHPHSHSSNHPQS